MTQNYTSTAGLTTTGSITRGFENHRPGASYDRNKQQEDWDYRDGASSTAEIAEISSDIARSGDNSLKVTYSSEERAKTASKFELPEEKEYFSSYWVYFDEDFSFNGVEKSGGKLPGLGSDEVPTGGDDVTGENGFSARYMWRYDGQAELYLYHVDKAGTFGDSVKFRNDAGEYKFFETGKWHNIIQRVKVNDDDEYNGEIDVWLDGEQVVDIDGVRLSTNDQGVDVFYLSTFYGGGSTDWLPPEDTEAYFDDFVIGTNPEDVGLTAADIRSPEENPDQRPVGNGVVRGIQEFQPVTTEQELPDGSTGEIYHDKQWGDGYTATLLYTPAADASGWTIQVRTPGPIEDIWNGEIVSYENDVYTIRATTNSELDAGETARIRIKGEGHGSLVEFVDGRNVAANTSSQPGPTPTPAPDLSPTPEPDPASTADADLEAAPMPGDEQPLDDPDPVTRPVATAGKPGDGSVEVSNQWNSGFTANLVFAAETNVDDWRVQIRFDGEIERIWNGEIVARDGDVYTISGLSYNSALVAGESAGVGFKGSGSPDRIEVLGVMYDGFDTAPTPQDPSDAPNDHADDGPETGGDTGDHMADDGGMSGDHVHEDHNHEGHNHGDQMDGHMDADGEGSTPLMDGGKVHVVGQATVVTDFDPRTDVLDLGPLSIHTQIVVDAAEGLVVMHMFDFDQSLLLEGVYLKDLQAANFAPISDAHLQQDLSAALAWENGTGLVREDTIYLRSHEAGLEEIVDFNPQTDTVSFFYLSVRGDNQLNYAVEETAEGVRFFSPLTGQSLTLRDTTFDDLDSSHFEWRANQLEDNIAGRIGLSDVIDGFEYDTANIYSGKSVPMAGLVDRAPYHTQPDYTGTPISSHDRSPDAGGDVMAPVAPPASPVVPAPSTPSTNLIFELVDTRTNTVIAQVADGQALPAGLTDGRNLSIVVSAEDPDFADEIGSIRLTLGDHVQVENFTPYALFGDNLGDFRDGTGLGEGAQKLTVEVFSGAQASGRKLIEQDVEFEVHKAPEDTSTDVPGAEPEAQAAADTDDTEDGTVVSNPALTGEDGIAVANSPFTTGDYAQVLNMSMQFYYAQYAGDLPDDFPITWRGDSVLDDGASVGRDLSGGWFDAGDHVKFGLPMAATATMLAWGGIEFEDGYRATGAYDDLDTHLRHVTDYFLQAYDDKGTVSVADDVFHAQVGDGNIDHSYWGSPEDMDLERPVYSIDAENPGTEVAAETAAALASASIFFRNQGDTAYADTLVAKAAKLHEFAETYQGTYNDSVPDATQFYKSYNGTYQDELSWSAAWLYKATGEKAYLDQAEEYWDYPWTSGAQSWDNKSNGVTLLLAQETGDQKYIEQVENHIDFWINDIGRTGSTDTNDGLGWLMQWGSNRMAANASLVATVWAKDLAEEGNSDARVAEILNFVTDQLDFMLGDNPNGQSFVVGFGDDFPLNPHHRAASGTFLDDPEVNNYILNGALVGGPSDLSGTYNDVRTDYITNEVATDYNAGFSGALAGAFEAFHEGWLV